MADETVSGRADVSLAGTITARSSARVPVVLHPILSGTITVRGKIAGQLPPYLQARITARARLSGRFPPYLIARATARSSASTLPLVFHGPQQELRLLYGRVQGVARLQLRPPRFTATIAGTIKARSAALVPIATLITTPTVFLVGRLVGAAKLRLTAPSLSPNPINLPGGRITARAKTQLGTDAHYYTKFLAARITGRSWISGTAGPWQNRLIGRITGHARGGFGPLELVEPLPPYPSPFPTYDVRYYLDRITSEHNQRPRYMATVGMSVDPMIEDQQLVAGFPGLFDLDYCVGQQEDFTGQWIGKSRWIELPATYFSWDEEGLGWNQANWKGPMDADSGLQRLDDYHYRLLLYATVIANHWNGSIPAAYEAWDTLFEFTGLKVVIQDYGNMTMLYGLLSTATPDMTLLSLFTTGQMDLRPEGISLRAYALQPTPGKPFFSWDSNSDSVNGWDSGYWGIMLEPGQSYIPGVGTVWDISPPSGRGPGQQDTVDDEPTIWDDGDTVWDK